MTLCFLISGERHQTNWRQSAGVVEAADEYRTQEAKDSLLVSCHCRAVSLLRSILVGFIIFVVGRRRKRNYLASLIPLSTRRASLIYLVFKRYCHLQHLLFSTSSLGFPSMPKRNYQLQKRSNQLSLCRSFFFLPYAL